MRDDLTLSNLPIYYFSDAFNILFIWLYVIIIMKFIKVHEYVTNINQLIFIPRIIKSGLSAYVIISLCL